MTDFKQDELPEIVGKKVRANDEARGGVKKLLNGSSLPFNELRQQAFLGHVMVPQTGLFRLVNGIAKSDWFSTAELQHVWMAIARLYEDRENKSYSPTAEEIKGSESILKRVVGDKPEEIARLRSFIDICTNARLEIREDILKQEIERWMHAKILQNAIREGTRYYNQEDFAASQAILLESYKQFTQVSMVLADDAPESVVETLIEGMSEKKVIPFGLQSMDGFMYPDNPLGSLCMGDQTVFIAPINIGKTTSMCTVAVHNIMADKLGAYVACEGNKYNIRMKMIRCYFTLMTAEELLKGILAIYAKKKVKDPFGIDPVRAAVFALRIRELAAKTPAAIIQFLTTKGQSENNSKKENEAQLWIYTLAIHLIEYLFTRLQFLYLVKPDLSFEEVQVALERANTHCLETHQRGFDLVCVDYPGVLTTQAARGGRFEQRQITQRVYQSFEALAGLHQWHSLVAIQTNRTGSKINAGVDSEGKLRKRSQRFLMNEDVSEVFGALMGAATVITINRTPEDQLANRCTFVVTKSRGSGVYFAVTCRSNFAQGVSHSNEMGSVGYYGTQSSPFIISEYLKPGQNKILTQDEIIIAEQNQEQAVKETMEKDDLTAPYMPG